MKPKSFALFSLLFFLLLMAVFRSFVFDDARLLLNADQLKSMGSRYLTHELILPEWDNSKLGGLPTLDAMYGDAYHPFRLLQSVMEPARAVGWKFILSVQLAFMGGLLLFGKLARSERWGAVISLLYSFNPHFFTLIYPGHDGKMMALAALPWLLWGLLALSREGKEWGAAVIALSLTWMVLSSHLQVVYFVLWGVLFLSLFLHFGDFPEGEPLKTRVWKQGLVGIAVAAALGLASFQILPQRAYLSEHSVRGSEEKTSYGHAVSWSLHPEEVASLVLPGWISRESDRSGPDGQGVVEKHYWGRNFLKLNHDGIGAVLLLLGLLGVSRRSLRKEGAFWIAASALVLTYSVGGHTPLFRLFYDWLPGVNNFRAPAMAGFWLPMGAAWMGARWLGERARDEGEGGEKGERDETGPLAGPLVAAAVVGGVLALARGFWGSFLGVPAALFVLAIGVTALAALTGQSNRSRFGLSSYSQLFSPALKAVPLSLTLAVAAATAVGVMIVTGADTLYTTPGVRDYFVPLHTDLMARESGEVWISLILFLLAAGSIYWAFSGPRNGKHRVAVVLAIGGLELFRTLAPSVDTVPVEPVLPSSLRADWTAMQTQEGKAPPADFRLLSLGGINDNLGNYIGFRSVLGFHDNELDRFRIFTGGPSREHLMIGLREGRFDKSPFLNLLNARYIFANGQLFANPKAIPRVALYDSAIVVPAAGQIEFLKAGAIDEQTVAMVEELPGGVELPRPRYVVSPVDPDVAENLPVDSVVAPVRSRMSPGEATILNNDSPDRVTVRTSSLRPTFLFHSENWMPGWRATVDGNPVPVLRAFTTLQAVPVPAGEHTVELLYRSPEQERVRPLVAVGGVLTVLLIGNGAVRRKRG